MKSNREIMNLLESKIDAITGLSIECIEQIYKVAWNEAIEAAAKMVEDSDVMMDGRFDLIEQIRKLKK